MNAHTTMSEKGQVVIPKDVRRRFHFGAGDQLDVIERPDGVLLRKRSSTSSESFEAVTSRIRSRIDGKVPSLSIDDMSSHIATMWADGGPRWDR